MSPTFVLSLGASIGLVVVSIGAAIGLARRGSREVKQEQPVVDQPPDLHGALMNRLQAELGRSWGNMTPPSHQRKKP